MALVGFALLLAACSARAAGASQCQALGAGGAASCSTRPGLALLQTHHASSKVELAAAEAGSTAIQSGDTVLFRVARTGHRLTAQEDGTVHAKWDHATAWQQFVIEKEAGSGDVQSGDAVFLTAWTGKRITVGDYKSGDLDRKAVHAKWSHKGDWSKLAIEKSGDSGPIMAGDEIFLQAWTGAMLDADAPDSAGVVQARWNHQGDWQKMTIESTAPATTAAPAPTTPAPEPVTTKALPQKAATTPPVATMPPPESEVEVVSARAWEHFQLLNQLRAEGFTCPQGAVFEPNPIALKFDCRLWRASRLHSEDMAAQNYFGDTSKDGRSFMQRAEEQGTDAHGENIAAGSSTAAGALGQFQNSDGHCKSMMRKDFKVAAVGYGAGGRYGHYWTQMFSLFDSDPPKLDTTCYPSDVALMQRDQGGAADIYEKVLAEAWSRLPA